MGVGKKTETEKQGGRGGGLPRGEDKRGTSSNRRRRKYTQNGGGPRAARERGEKSGHRIGVPVYTWREKSWAEKKKACHQGLSMRGGAAKKGATGR